MEPEASASLIGGQARSNNVASVDDPMAASHRGPHVWSWDVCGLPDEDNNMSSNIDQPTEAEQSNGQQSEGAEKEAKAAMQAIEQKSKDALGRIGEAMKEPASGAAITGAVVLGAAVTFGLLPTIAGAGAAYITYHVVTKRREQH
jgi:hypothetical protein